MSVRNHTRRESSGLDGWIPLLVPNLRGFFGLRLGPVRSVRSWGRYRRMPRRAEVPECLCRMLEQALGGRRCTRGHGRRQVDEPARVDGEAGHRLERGGAVLRADRHAPGDARVQPQRPGDVVEVEQCVALLLAGGASGGP